MEDAIRLCLFRAFDRFFRRSHSLFLFAMEWGRTHWPPLGAWGSVHLLLGFARTGRGCVLPLAGMVLRFGQSLADHRQEGVGGSIRLLYSLGKPRDRILLRVEGGGLFPFPMA